MMADPSEIPVTRADMTRLLVDEYEDVLREIEDPKGSGALTERRMHAR